MNPVISQTFAVTAVKPTISVDHIDNYYITEASGIMPAVSDSRWQLVPDGQQVPVPTASAPYLWHKYITYLTDGSALDPIVEFAGSLGQNGFDFDLVPSHSAIIKDANDNLSPANVSCSLIKRNADGSAETQSVVPSGYSVIVYRDNTSSSYTLGSNVSTAGITSVITFVLKYGNIEVERHDLRVIAEGAEGLTGRGIQSQDTRFKATTTNSIPATPTNDNTWNTWSSLASCGYSQSTPYLWKCIKTVYLNGNGTTETEYLVEGPTVWGQDGADAIFIDLDNELDAIPCDSTGKVTVATTLVTYARLYRGSDIINDGLTAPVAANCKLGSVTPTITPQQDGAYKLEWVFAVNTQLSADRLTASIAIGYASKSYPAVFTANVVKSGAPGVSPAIYQLLLSQNDASFARNSSNQLTPASISIRCGYTKNYNGSIVKHDGDQASDLQNIDGTYNILYRAIAANGSPGNWAWMKDLSSSNFYLVIPNSTTNTAYEFILTTANSASAVAESNIFDRETLPINKDGLNGAPGESALIIDLDNEQDAFGTKADGKIAAAVSRETTASMFYGITPLSATYSTTKTYEDGTTCGSEVSVDVNSETGKITVTMGSTSHVYNKTIFIDITGTASGYTDKPKTARFTIQPQAAGTDGLTPVIYQLMPSPSSLSFARKADGTLNMANNVITGYVKKIVDEETTILSSLSGYRIYYGYGNPATPSNFISVGGTITVSASNAASYASLVLELWKMNGSTKEKRLDRETIPINKEGQKGQQGDPGDTPFIIDIDNEMTSIPISTDGKVESQITLDFHLAAYYGSTNVINDCTVSLVGTAPTGFNVDVVTDKTTPRIVIAANIQPAEITELRFQVVHSDYGTRQTRYATFTVCAVKSGGRGEDAEIYQLKPSHTALQFARNSSGNLTGSYTLTCQIQKTVGSTTSNHDSLSGYYIYYGWDGAASPSTSLPTSGRSVGTSEAGSHTSVVLELWRGQRSASGSVRLDRETIPILKDGAKGGDGDSGNGINGIYFYRMFTQSFEAPAENDSGWIASTSGSYPTEAGLTKENRYLWQKKLTSYTRSDTPTIEISLLAQFDTGVQENLLEDTAFLSEGQMEAWTDKNGGIGVNTVGSHNSFGGTPVWENFYTELLKQNVYEYGVLQKLKANTWYTLSFWGAMMAYQDLLSSSVYNGSDGGSYWQIGASRRGFWLEAGQQAIVTVTGRCYSSNVYLKVFGFEQNWESGLTTSVTFTSTSSQTKSFLVKNTSSANKYFCVEGYVYLSSDDSQNTYTDINHRCYITLIRVDRGCKMASYLYRSDNGQAVQHSSSAPWYVDGKKYTAATTIPNPTGGRNVTLVDGTTANVQDGTFVGFANDGYVYWQLSPGTYRHSVTFKTPSSLSTSAQYRVLFCLISRSHYGWISMPKLEENTIATDWIENTNDRMADDIQHVYDGPWESGKTYFYGGGTGVRHVVRAKESVSGAMTYWRMKQRTTSSGYTSTTQPYNDTTHWEKASYLKFLASDFALIENAIINFQQTNRILVYNSAGNVAAGMGGAEGGSADYPLWVGADYANRATAAFRVSLTGILYATGAHINGSIDATNITANSGKIAGFTLSGNGLTNIVSQSDMSQSSNMGYIICRNDYYGRFAGIGANVLPATSGLVSAVARFENTDSHSWYSTNIALLLRAENGQNNNFAFTGTGNGVLNGWVGGYKYSRFILTSTNTIYDGYVTLKENNVWFIKANVSNSGIALPKLSKVRDALGIGSSTNFCVRLLICADINSNQGFDIYGRNQKQSSSGTKTWYTDDLPLMTHWDNSNWDTCPMGQGDSLELLLVYDSSRTETINGYSTKYTARIINRQD